MKKKRKADGKRSHVLLHTVLIIFTTLAIYPVLWVFNRAFSGNQSLVDVDLPADPSLMDRLRYICLLYTSDAADESSSV